MGYRQVTKTCTLHLFLLHYKHYVKKKLKKTIEYCSLKSTYILLREWAALADIFMHWVRFLFSILFLLCSYKADFSFSLWFLWWWNWCFCFVSLVETILRGQFFSSHYTLSSGESLPGDCSDYWEWGLWSWRGCSAGALPVIIIENERCLDNNIEELGELIKTQREHDVLWGALEWHVDTHAHFLDDSDRTWLEDFSGRQWL